MIFLIDYFIYQNFIFIIINYFKKICSQHHIMNQKINFVLFLMKFNFNYNLLIIGLEIHHQNHHLDFLNYLIN